MNYVLDFVILPSSRGFHIAASLPVGYRCTHGKQEVEETILREAHLSGAVLQQWVRIICRQSLPFHLSDSQCPLLCNLEHYSWCFRTLCLPMFPFPAFLCFPFLKRNHVKHFSSPVGKKDADLDLTGALQLPMQWFAPFSSLTNKWQVNKASSLEEACNYLWKIIKQPRRSVYIPSMRHGSKETTAAMFRHSAEGRWRSAQSCASVIP